MKKLYSLIILLIISLFALTAQPEGYRGQRKTLDNIPCRVRRVDFDSSSKALDIYFSSAIDPRSVRPESITINDSPVRSKITFNRDGNQVRVIIDQKSPFTVRISGIKSYEGNSVESFSKRIQ